MPLAIFDLDGTLVDTAPSIVRSLDALLYARGLASTLDAQTKRYWALHNARALVEHAWPHALSAQELDTHTDELIAHYRCNLVEGVQVFPGVVGVLESLKRMGWSLAICSNKKAEFIYKLVCHLGLAPYFNIILGGDSLPFKKPSGKPLEAIAHILCEQIECSVMVGDTWIDIHASLDAGMPCIVYDCSDKFSGTERDNLEKNVHILYAWEQFVPLLEQVFSCNFFIQPKG